MLVTEAAAAEDGVRLGNTKKHTRAHLRASNLRAELQRVQQRSTGDAGH